LGDNSGSYYGANTALRIFPLGALHAAMVFLRVN